MGYYYDMVQIAAEQNGDGEHHHIDGEHRYIDEELNSKKRKLNDQDGMSFSITTPSQQ